MTPGLMAKARDTAAYERRLTEMCRGIDIIRAGFAIEIAGAGWRVRRADACTITTVLDDYAGLPAEP